MAETTVYFATNRKATGANGFGADIVGPDPAQMTYGSVHVSNIDLDDADSASHQYYGKSRKVRADIVAIMSGGPSGPKIAAL